MKLLKDDKYNAILSAARSEFIHHGFKDASMRAIAKEANVGLSNIYNYFKNKNDLFLAVVKPAKDDFYAFIREHHTNEHIDFNRMSTFGYQHDIVETYITLIDKYRQELSLLLFHADGSELKGFRDTFTDYLTRTSMEQMKIVKKRYPESREMSEFLVHTLSSWMVTILGEIVSHNLSKPRIRAFFEEYFKFEFAGWREIVGV